MSAEEVAKAFVQHFYQTFDAGVDALGGLFVSHSFFIVCRFLWSKLVYCVYAFNNLLVCVGVLELVETDISWFDMGILKAHVLIQHFFIFAFFHSPPNNQNILICIKRMNNQC